jgi:hypothetical protein
MVGSSVSNENNETVGTIDDLIITDGGQAPYAILSVGGFLGLGTKYVALPFTSLKIVDKKSSYPGHKGRSAGSSRFQIQYQQLMSGHQLVQQHS